MDKVSGKGYFWWPGLDSAIGERVSACHVCAVMGKSPPRAPLHYFINRTRMSPGRSKSPCVPSICITTIYVL